MKRGGYYLIEVGVAIAVMAVVLTAFSSQLFIAYQSHTAAGRKNYAVFLAEEGMQALKNIRDQRFFDIATTTPNGVRFVEICPTPNRCVSATGPGRTWGLSDFANSTKLSNTINSSNLQRRIVITQLDTTPLREKVKVRVEVIDWNGSYWPANRNPKVLTSLESAFENWSPTVINWKDILYVGDYDFDPPHQHDFVAADTSDHYLFIINNAAGSTSGEKFVIFNIVRSPLITVSSTLNLSGKPKDLDYYSGSAYITSDSNSQEVQVVAVNAGSIVNRFGMDMPAGSVVDTVNHRLFVSEFNNNRVLVYNLNNSNALLDRLPDYVLGQRNFFRRDSSTSQTGLRSPTGLAFDGANRLFVSDTNNHRVLVFTVASVSTNMKASYVLGKSDFTTRDTAASQSGMNSPRGVTYSTVFKQLFVADAFNNRTLVFDLGGSVSIANGQNASSVLGQKSFTANGAATTSSSMRTPYDVAYDSAGKRLFVADRDNHRVLYFNAKDGIANGQSASSVLGQTTFTTTITPNPPTANSAWNPIGVVFDSTANRLFVSDSGNNRVLVYDLTVISDGMAAQNVLGQPSFTSRAVANPPTQSSLSDPRGLAYDSGNSRLFIADHDNHRVPIFDLAGGVSDGASSTDLLGQYDDAFDPDYTKNQTNNYGGNLQAILVNAIDMSGIDDALAVAAGGGGIGPANCAGTCLFIGRNSSGGSQNFFVFDITVPRDPVLIGSTTLDGVPRSMAVNGNYIYVAADLGGGKGALIQVNAAVSSSPQQAWRYDDGNQMPTARTIAVNPAGTRVALGTDGADAAGRDGIYLFDISANPPALTNPSPNPFDDNNDWQKDDDVVKLGFVPSSHLLAVLQRRGKPDKLEALDVSGDAMTYAASSSLPGALNGFVWSDLFMTAYVVAKDDPEIKIVIPSSTYCPGC